MRIREHGQRARQCVKGSTGFEGDISGGGVASVARSSSFIEVDIGCCECNGDWWWLRVEAHYDLLGVVVVVVSE